MTPHSGHLSDRDSQAIALAHGLRQQLGHWLARRGASTGFLLVSPFVDRSGQPSVLIRMDITAARALFPALAESHRQERPAPDPWPSTATQHRHDSGK